MTPEADNATDSVIDLANSVGATAIGVQNTTQTVRSLRRAAVVAARHPERLAALGLTLLATSGALTLRQRRAHGQHAASTRPPAS